MWGSKTAYFRVVCDIATLRTSSDEPSDKQTKKIPELQRVPYNKHVPKFGELWLTNGRD